MYELKTRNKKVEKKLKEYINLRKGIKDKLDRLRQNPRRECGAHQLHGILKGKWVCWLGSNIRMVYEIADAELIILVEEVGTHNKVY
ncbi:MAG: type II toxin-antitoxin system mRNA interferase toxin, RelE/StbE family [Nanoarchaeota archaeon]